MAQIDAPSEISGSRVRQARLLKGYTIRELAKLIEVTPQTISNIERNVVSTPLATLRELSVVLDKPISYLGCFNKLPEDTLAQRIRKARHYRGLQLKEAAGELGVSAKTLNNWEAGRRKPSLANLPAVIKFTQVLKLEKPLE